MGYNTTINILNDGFDQIEKHPEEFVRGVAEKMHEGGNVGVGNHANSVQVARTGHADEFRLYVVKHNSMVELSPFNQETTKIAAQYPDKLRSIISGARHMLDILEENLDELTHT